jgi:RNA polymerase sigma-70 factor (ECF subfamily)
MSVEAKSRPRSRDIVERVISFPRQTASSLPSRVSLIWAEEADGGAVAAPPTFNEVLARYQDAIYHYALHLTGNRVAADEVYQETILTAYHEFDRLDGNANHRAWLYQIATNAFFRNRRRRSKEGSLVQASTEPLPTASDAVQPEAAALLAEVAAFLGNLPPKPRLALIQRTYHDLSYAEIAAILRCSEATARTWIYQALRTLRDHCGERL